jgi:hypothetical protein
MESDEAIKQYLAIYGKDGTFWNPPEFGVKFPRVWTQNPEAIRMWVWARENCPDCYLEPMDNDYHHMVFGNADDAMWAKLAFAI